ncbi:hypothetical protein L1049_010609 [Liquidambar formosana]|uniref:Uncharacterized protein n=1 Tax=Liquidambar formosana TaxID=63359 RepID=A0AAP0R436_LIQFO
MATHQAKKVSLDVAADNSSDDSFSFAGLLCIQDQNSKFHSGLVNPLPTLTDASQIQKQDTEFAFGHATPGLATNDPNKNSPADQLFFKGELLPQVFPFQSKQSQVTSHNSCNNTLPATRSISKRSGDNDSGCQDSATRNPNTEVRNQAKKKHSAERPSFGWRIFSSLVSPCRECHAVEPSMKEHTVPRNTIKIQ